MLIKGLILYLAIYFIISYPLNNFNFYILKQINNGVTIKWMPSKGLYNKSTKQHSKLIITLTDYQNEQPPKKIKNRLQER